MENINIKLIEIENVLMFDYPDFCDAFISYAETNDGKVLTDEELEELTENNPGFINETIFEKQLYI